MPSPRRGGSPSRRPSAINTGTGRCSWLPAARSPQRPWVNHDMAEEYGQGCGVLTTGIMLTQAVMCTRRACTEEGGSGHD
jgi:hypothetical protein